MPALKVTDWPQLVDEFFADRRAHGLQERSLEFTEYGVERFLLWTAESRVKPTDFASRHLRAFLAWLQLTGSRHRDGRKGQRLAPRSLHAYSRVVRALPYFGGREGMLEAVPVMEMPKVPKPDPDYLRDGEVERLRAACRRPRDRALFELMLDSGLRRGEVSRLTWADLMPGPALVRVRVRHGKGDRPRVTYCSLQTWRLLCEWQAREDACVNAETRCNQFKRLLALAADKKTASSAVAGCEDHLESAARAVEASLVECKKLGVEPDGAEDREFKRALRRYSRKADHRTDEERSEQVPELAQVYAGVEA